MGCSPSNVRNGNKSRKGSAEPVPHENEELDDENRKILLPTPYVKVDIGNGILPIVEETQAVIFIFGGPGSLKGVLLQDLACEFDFITVNVEDIVFSYLPSKVANTVKDTVEMQNLMKRDQNIITLDWILSMISAKLSTSTSQRFIIDIVPELSSMLKTESFKSSRHDDQLKNFERKHPIMMALELCVSEEKLLLERRSEGSASTNKVDMKDLSPELSAFMKGIDEADKGRIETRLESYHSCANPFLEYFRESKRVVQFDLRVPGNTGILPAVRNTLSDFGFARNNDFIRVVLFVMSDRQAANIDMDYYRLRKIRLSDIDHDDSETMSHQIRSLRRYIYRTAKHNENILVVLNCLNNTDYPPNKRINFIESKTTFLDYYIRNRRKRTPSQRCKMNFRAIISTTHETCLFPETMPVNLCKKIGYIFGEKLSLSENGSRSASRLSNLPLIDENSSPNPLSKVLTDNGLLTVSGQHSSSNSSRHQRSRSSSPVFRHDSRIKSNAIEPLET